GVAAGLLMVEPALVKIPPRLALEVRIRHEAANTAKMPLDCHDLTTIAPRVLEQMGEGQVGPGLLKEHLRRRILGLADGIVVDHRLLKLRFVHIDRGRHTGFVADSVKVPAVERRDVRGVAEGTPATNPFTEPK